MAIKEPDEDEPIFTIIDVYPAFENLAYLYISEGPCETAAAKNREILYDLPDFLKDRKPSLSHLVSGDDPAKVYGYLEDILGRECIPYNTKVISEGVLYQVTVNRSKKREVEHLISIFL